MVKEKEKGKGKRKDLINGTLGHMSPS